jgi:hypothetical protein
MMRKKRPVKKKYPFVVGHPVGLAISIKDPKRNCKSLQVSGFTTKKKTRAL